MDYRKLGKADFQVSAITLGCMGFMGGTDWTHQDDADSGPCHPCGAGCWHYNL